MQLDDLQNQAIERCVDSARRTVAVTGPAGSGKTTIMRQVHAQLTEQGYKCAVAAPTGKAAKRITEATGLPAMTIHRLLEFTHPGEIDPATGSPIGVSVPRRNAKRKIQENVVLCDEYAMVNQEVHECLMAAMPSGALLRVFGDANQLAPIEDRPSDRERPSAFMNLLNNFDGVRLERIHRQGEGSGIASNGFRILVGRTPARTDDFFFRVVPTEGCNAVIKDELFEKVLCAHGEGVFFNTLDNQIITPAKRSEMGTAALNSRLQQLYLAHQDTVPDHLDVPRWSETEAKVRMYVGDKVICSANNYDLNIFNGETGIIKEINKEFGTMLVDFGDREVEIPPVIMIHRPDGSTRHYDPRKNIDLAYVITTHKAQGSEYQHVIYILSPSSGRLRTRRNFYTGVTRARTRCTVLADSKSWSYALWNTKDNF